MQTDWTKIKIIVLAYINCINQLNSFLHQQKIRKQNAIWPMRIQVSNEWGSLYCWDHQFPQKLLQACLRAPPMVADEAKLAIVFTYFFAKLSSSRQLQWQLN